MALDFSAITPATLRAAGGLKWSDPQQVGAFVAEMDFGIAPQITTALIEQIHRAQTGYPPPALLLGLRDAVHGWLAERYGWQVDPASLRLAPDVLSILKVFADHFVPDGPFIVCTPAYVRFIAARQYFGRDIIQVPLARAGDGYTFDLDGIDAAFRAGGRLLLLCNPYNPVGRVFTHAELAALAEVVERHGGRVFNDEIHAPLVFAPHRHVPYPTVSPAAAAHSITALAASKAWNLPGLRCAQLVLTNPADVPIWDAHAELVGQIASNPGILASTVAYSSARGWLDEVLEYLAGNRDQMISSLAQALPLARATYPQGTYLLWVDFSAYDLAEEPAQFFTRTAGVRFTPGTDCGQVGAGHVRMNLATTRPILADIVDRLATALAGTAPRR